MSRTQEQISEPCNDVYAGIDVGKAHLDVFIHPLNIKLKIDNDQSGVRKLVRLCVKHDVRLVAMEATGKYHRHAHEALHAAGVPVAVVNPFRSRQFADSLGKLAKTDAIDAKILASFAQLIQPEPTPPPTKQQKALRDLNTARRQVLQEIGDLKRQLYCTDHALAARQIRARLKMAERHKAVLEVEIETLIQADAEMREKFSILTSIPFIGKVTATVLISDLSELGNVNSKQIAALAGVAPMSWDSGAKQGQRMIRGGRQTVRNALYMCAVGLTRHKDGFGQHYQRLVGLGKHPKVAITAVMRKLVILANTLIAENRCWRPVRP